MGRTAAPFTPVYERGCARFELIAFSALPESGRRDLNPRPPEPHLRQRGSGVESRAKSHVSAPDYIEGRECVWRLLRRETDTTYPNTVEID
jgi:hypothetical protein